MKIYSLLKLFMRIKSNRLRLMGIGFLHLCGRRYIGIYMDPAMGCNLRCRMCHYSGNGEILKDHSKMTPEQTEQVANALFHRALKLQIGCGAEPTLYRDLPGLVQLAKSKGVPYVSLTTNGQLLNEERMEALAQAGLDEITLSMHGFTREVYESFMPHAKFETLQRLFKGMACIQERFPSLKLRINFTINEDNMFELSHFPRLMEGVRIDVLQMRPIQDLQHSDYQNFSLQGIKEHYEEIFAPLRLYCDQRHIVLLYPECEDLDVLAEEEPNHLLREIQDLTYCYVHPGGCWKEDFDCTTDTFETYCRRKHRTRHILALLFGRGKHILARAKTKALNYHVK